MSLFKYWLVLASVLISCATTAAPEDNDQLAAGGFMVRSQSATDFKPALLLSTDVKVQVTGPIARVVVKQQFYNQAQEFVEGKYLFPLPEQAAVNAMTMTIGDRIIKGEIQEKQQAQRIYQQAKAEGKRAGLVEQQRPNLFTTQIANIAPGETIAVEIVYIETLARHGNEFSFSFPMTLTPRYTPEPLTPEALTVQTQFIKAKTVPKELANPARIQVQIEKIAHLKNITSSSHDIVEQNNQNQIQINTRDAFVPMDRDFKLHWKIASDSTTVPAFYADRVDGEHYGLLMLMPSEAPAETQILPRETIFIIDTSGSMGGESIEQAKAGLQYAVEQLDEHQRFNIIEFNSVHRTLFSESRQVTPDSRAQALEFVGHLQAEGGTEMAPALRTALSMPTDPEYLRQVIFITDGSVTNEDELFGIIHQLLGESRLFTVGIGSAPNSYFMKKAAEFGRGTQTQISQLNQVKEKMDKLFNQLRKPLLRDLQLHLPEGITAEFYPEKIPDLYAGEPVLVAMKLNAIPDQLRVTGKSDSPWAIALETGEKAKASSDKNGIASLWARAKIESLSAQILRGNNSESIKRDIIDAAFRHQLVSQFTSFIAVEEVIARPQANPLQQEQLANLLPKGSTMLDARTNSNINSSTGYPSTAAGVELFRYLGLLLLMIYGWLRWTSKK